MQSPTCKIMRYLPEYILTDMTDFYQYIMKHRSDCLTYFLPEDVMSIIEAAIIIIRSPKAITNPYIACKFVEVISMITYHEKKVNWIGHFAESDIILNYVMEAFIQFYVDLEGSGGRMFYEKFSYRYDCGSIFRRLWKLKIFKEKFTLLVGSELMEKFINCLLNDTSHCLEEGISKIAEIKTFETKVSKGYTPTDEDKSNHEKNENICRSNLQLANENIWMVKQISDWAKESFNNEVFANRMASSLNFVLNRIVGPQCIELKVNDPKKYKFKPIELLSDLACIYINLSSIEIFNKAVSGDDIFKIENAQKASQVIGLSKFIENLNEVNQQIETNEEEKLYDEAPDDFLCPIAYCFMRDPVKLPTSGVTVDRSTIKRHLLNDEHDPFSRAPLKLSQIEDDIIF